MDGRRPPRRSIGVANWALAGIVALCMLLSIGQLEDWASSPATVAAKVAFNRTPSTDSPSAADPVEAWIIEARQQATLIRSPCGQPAYMLPGIPL